MFAPVVLGISEELLCGHTNRSVRLGQREPEGGSNNFKLVKILSKKS